MLVELNILYVCLISASEGSNHELCHGGLAAQEGSEQRAVPPALVHAGSQEAHVL